MLITGLEVIWSVDGSMELKRIKIGNQLRYRSTGPPDRSTGFVISGQPESMYFWTWRFSLSRSTGLRDRSTGLPRIRIFALVDQSQPLDHPYYIALRDFASHNPNSENHFPSSSFLLSHISMAKPQVFYISLISISQVRLSQVKIKEGKVLGSWRRAFQWWY